MNRKTFRMTTVEKQGALTGTEGETYFRVPMLLMLATAPLLGLVFVIFLPFIGFAAVAYLAGQKVVEVIGGAATQAQRVVRPSWAPSLAFLSRSKPAKKSGEAHVAAPHTDEWTEDVEKKLDDAKRDA